MNTDLISPTIIRSQEFVWKPLTSRQKLIKRALDIFGSVCLLIITSPLLLLCAILTKLSSKGKIIYKQQRVGYKGKGFIIYKFRSMMSDAEKNGPVLSCDKDERITKWGSIMRRLKLDELPQLWNILKGEMSFVGPRPEREFFIKQIRKQTAHFENLLFVKPGLTSLGMINYGAACSIEQLLERMKYDRYYIQHFSILLDFKIIIKTLILILKSDKINNR